MARQRGHDAGEEARAVVGVDDDRRDNPLPLRGVVHPQLPGRPRPRVGRQLRVKLHRPGGVLLVQPPHRRADLGPRRAVVQGSLHRPPRQHSPRRQGQQVAVSVDGTAKADRQRGAVGPPGGGGDDAAAVAECAEGSDGGAGRLEGGDAQEGGGEAPGGGDDEVLHEGAVPHEAGQPEERHLEDPPRGDPLERRAAARAGDG